MSIVDVEVTSPAALAFARRVRCSRCSSRLDASERTEPRDTSGRRGRRRPGEDDEGEPGGEPGLTSLRSLCEGEGERESLVGLWEREGGVLRRSASSC